MASVTPGSYTPAEWKEIVLKAPPTATDLQILLPRRYAEIAVEATTLQPSILSTYDENNKPQAPWVEMWNIPFMKENEQGRAPEFRSLNPSLYAAYRKKLIDRASSLRRSFSPEERRTDPIYREVAGHLIIEFWGRAFFPFGGTDIIQSKEEALDFATKNSLHQAMVDKIHAGTHVLAVYGRSQITDPHLRRIWVSTTHLMKASYGGESSVRQYRDLSTFEDKAFRAISGAKAPGASAEEQKGVVVIDGSVLHEGKEILLFIPQDVVDLAIIACLRWHYEGWCPGIHPPSVYSVGALVTLILELQKQKRSGLIVTP